MRGALVVVGLLLFGIAAWFVLQDGAGSAPPVTTIAVDDDDGPARQPQAPIAREAADVPERPTAEPSPEPAPSPPDEPEPEPAAAPRLILDVFEAGSHAPVLAFRWRFSQHGSHHHGEVDGHHAELPMQGLQVGELLVESDGRQPHRQQLTLPANGSAPLRLELFLAATAAAEGIALWVRDLDRMPVPHVRVDAHQLDEHNRAEAWHLGAPLWKRRTAAPNGHYVLPPLPPGEYGIVLVATDADGELLPMQPFRRAFVLSGSNGYVEDVTLEPGCALTLELVRNDGQPLDPSAGTVALVLQRPGETGVQRKWTTAGPDGLVSAADILPGKAPVWPSEPLAGGSYELQVIVDGALRVSQLLVLQNGRRQTERIVVP